MFLKDKLKLPELNIVNKISDWLNSSIKSKKSLIGSTLLGLLGLGTYILYKKGLFDSAKFTKFKFEGGKFVYIEY